jgi:predicted O-methyltransferase YrrM
VPENPAVPSVSENPAVVENPAAVENPAVVEGPTVVEGPAAVKGPAAVEGPAAGNPAVADFATAFALAASISGWLTRDQARRLWAEACRVGDGARIVEVGCHQGRSTVMLAAAATGAQVVAIDPFIDGAMFGGLATRDKFVANLVRAGVADRVELRQARSTELRPGWSDRIDLLYIDGKHDYWTVSDDLRWASHVPDGGRVLVHDAFSSIGVTLGLLRMLISGARLRFLDRTGSLARFEVGAPTAAARLRLLAQLPWWLRNVAIKVGLRVARLFGNTTPDPY